jgi:hypothetical protein
MLNKFRFINHSNKEVISEENLIIDIKKNYKTKNGLYLGKLTDLSFFVHGVSIPNVRYSVFVLYSSVKELFYNTEGKCIEIIFQNGIKRTKEDKFYNISAYDLVEGDFITIDSITETIYQLTNIKQKLIAEINQKVN